MNNGMKDITAVIEVFKQADEVISSNLHYFVKPKDLRLSEPGISVSFNDTVDGYLIKLSCKTLAKNVYLSAPRGIFSDNYFDLVPGVPVAVNYVSAPSPARRTATFAESLKIMSLIDTIK